tara:strand:+ start:1739 stop:2617 length:879 start_codon:yes stop_codon:yes gene_type:complete
MVMEALLTALPSLLPPRSLRDFAFVAIIVPTVIQLLLLIYPYLRFRKMIPEKQTIKAVRLIDKLEIPRLYSWLFFEVSKILLPAILSLPVFYLFGLNELTFQDLDNYPWVKFLAAVLLLAWSLRSIYRVIQIRITLDDGLDKFQEQLDFMQKEIQKWTKNIPKVNSWEIVKDTSPTKYLQLLEYFVSMRELFSTASKKATGKTPKVIQDNVFPILGGFGKSITQGIKSVIEFPQYVQEEVSIRITEKINKEIEIWSSQIIVIDYISWIRAVSWSMAPSVGLGLLAWWNEIGA